MNLFKKKKKKIEEQLRSRTILSSLYGERWNLKYLENKIKNIKIDGYTKAEVDKMHQDMDDRLANHIQRYVELHDRVNSNLSDIVVLRTEQRRIKDKADSNKSEISNLKTELGNTNTKVENNKAEIDKLKNAKPAGNYADVDKENTFTQQNIFRKDIVVGANVYATKILVDNTDVTSDKSAVNVKHLKDTMNKYQSLQVGDYTSFNYQLKFHKKAISTPKYMFWYEIANGQELKLATNIQLKPNKEYMFFIHIKDMDDNNGVAELQHVAIFQREWITNDSDYIIKNLHLVNIFDGVTFISWRDYFPGNEGLFNRRVTLVCYWVPL